ncbi:MAG: pyridoxal-phosphate dependent enzyme, partial [Quisquiliibacterium sp.]
LLVCVGGAGLVSGCALAANAMSPGCEVIGVEPAAGNDVQLSLARGERVHIALPDTIADGAQTQQVGELTFPIVQALVSRIETVTDAQLVQAMRFFAERMKIVVEPTGCLAAAAALSGGIALAGKRVGIIISGGNIDAARYAQLLSQSSPA